MNDLPQDQTQSYSQEEEMQEFINRLRELDVKGYQPLTGAIGNKAADALASQAEQVRKLEEQRDGVIEQWLDEKRICREQLAALQARIEAADNQEPDGYTITFYEDTRGGDRKRITQCSIELHLPNIPLGVNNVEFRDLISTTPLFSRPPITSERELELLAVIEQMREALKPFAEHPDFHAPECWPVTFADSVTRAPGVTAGDFRKAKAALALTPDLSALKEHDARVLKEAVDWAVINKFGILTFEDLCRRAEERRKP